MGKRKLFLLAVLLGAVLYSGCSKRTVILIPDWAFSLWSSSSAEGPDNWSAEWGKYLEQAGIRLRFFPMEPGTEGWEGHLEASEGDFLVWTPLWSQEAFSFHASHPETPGILLFRGEGGLPPGGAENLTLLRPERKRGWDELAEILKKMDNDRVVGVFSSATNQRSKEIRFLIEEVDVRRQTIQGKKGVKAGQQFLENELTRGADFIILAGGGANEELYASVKDLSIPLFLEAPFPGSQDRENISGTFSIPWHEGILSLTELPYEDWPAELEVQTKLIWRGNDQPPEEIEP